jgi:hypothetical protein
MNVARIMAFLTDLRSYDKLAAYDQDFLKQFDAKFSSPVPSQPLSKELLDGIKTVFSSRWDLVVDKVDYTLVDDPVNRLWISLARDLSLDLKKKTPAILSPRLTNSLDPNNDCELADIDWRDLFVGEDKKTLYSIHGLMDNMRKKRLFCTYNSYKDEYVKKYRALSIRESLRIRLKKSPTPITYDGKIYASFFDCLVENVVPEWAKSGDLPRQKIHELTECIDLYFLEKHKAVPRGKFANKLYEWAKLLHELPIADVYCLYGQSIQVGESQFFFIEELLYCLENDFDTLHSHVLGIVRWLCEYDPSRIFTHEELNPLYASLHVGSFFCAEDLGLALSVFPVEYEDVDVAIKRLMPKLSENRRIDAEVKGLLAEVYQIYWSHKKNNLSEDKTTRPWIRLAQVLCGAGHIPENYYSFLYPTVTYSVDTISGLSLTSKPLSEYILSQDESQLLDLGNCVAWLKESGIFSNCYPATPKPFTELEKERMGHGKYKRFVKLADGAEDKCRISRTTWLAVLHLVDNSFFSNGLSLVGGYTPSQLESATKAYDIFEDFLKQLDPDEEKRLFDQRIHLLDRNYSFKKILDDARSDICVAICGKYLTKLVIDYNPTIRLSDDLDRNAKTAEMRLNSRKKLYYQGNIDGSDARHRIQVSVVQLIHYYLVHEKTFDKGMLSAFGELRYEGIPTQKHMIYIENLIQKILTIYSDKRDFLAKENEIDFLVTNLFTECDGEVRSTLLLLLSRPKIRVDPAIFHSMSVRFISCKLAVLAAAPCYFLSFFCGPDLKKIASIQKAFGDMVSGVYENMDALMTSIDACIDGLKMVNKDVKATMSGYIGTFIPKSEAKAAILVE